jgi:hypothetical protein
VAIPGADSQAALRKGLEGCEAATPQAGPERQRSPGKPGFRRFAPEMRQNSDKIFLDKLLTIMYNVNNV